MGPPKLRIVAALLVTCASSADVPLLGAIPGLYRGGLGVADSDVNGQGQDAPFTPPGHLDVHRVPENVRLGRAGQREDVKPMPA